jgi:hypothetical protein
MDKGNSVINISFVRKNFFGDVFNNVIQQKDVRQAKGIFLRLWEFRDQISGIQRIRDNDQRMAKDFPYKLIGEFNLFCYAPILKFFVPKTAIGSVIPREFLSSLGLQLLVLLLQNIQPCPFTPKPSKWYWAGLFRFCKSGVDYEHSATLIVHCDE